VLHRAVDELLAAGGVDGQGGGGGGDVEAAAAVVDAVSACGFDGVLTSGGRGRAVENVGRLKRVVEAAAAAAGGAGVEVVVGGGVRRENLTALVEGLGLEGGEEVWFHSSCLHVGEDGTETFDVEEARALAEEMTALGLTVERQ
jgi:copper homeostasis protein CutC